MVLPKFLPVESSVNLKERIRRLLRDSAAREKGVLQHSMDLSDQPTDNVKIVTPSVNANEFLNFVSDAVPLGDVYLFGGILRDIALFGRKGFDSDIDIVVDGDWSHLVSYLEALNARKNKFGGYRLQIGEWPVDIWQARETWAIKEGFVQYKNIASLTNTTVLNWDAILMNWRTGDIICGQHYFEELSNRIMDIVLTDNPNPLGAAVRSFRHLSLKDARKITVKAARYLSMCAKRYGSETIRGAELESYGNNYIEKKVINFFKGIDESSREEIRHQFSIARDIIEPSLVA